MTFAAIFALLVGIGMIGMWSISYFTKQIPELESEPVRIKFHLAAEFATALVLLIAGIGLFAKQAWAFSVYLVAVGMLIYTAIVSPGYFAQRGQWAYVGMFAVILVLAIVSISILI
jgi:hypothetical protein